MGVILAAAAIVVGAVASLLTLVLLLAGGANTSPGQARELKVMMRGVLGVAVVCCVGGVWAIAQERYAAGAALGAAPAAACIGLIAWMFITEY